MTRSPSNPILAQSVKATGGTVGTWKVQSPGTGGNIHAFAFLSDDDSALWVGSDNGGVMRGSRSPSTDEWSFVGEARGLEAKDTSSLTAVKLPQSSAVVYGVVGSGYGPGGLRDRKALVRWTGTEGASKVPMARYKHYWQTGVQPLAGIEVAWTPPSPKTPESKSTENCVVGNSSFVCALPLPGQGGRHLLVVGGNTASTPFATNSRAIRMLASESYRAPSYQIDAGASAPPTIAPYDAAPTFYACLGAYAGGSATPTYGSWVGATYREQHAVWRFAAGPTYLGPSCPMCGSGWGGDRSRRSPSQHATPVHASLAVGVSPREGDDGWWLRGELGPVPRASPNSRSLPIVLV